MTPLYIQPPQTALTAYCFHRRLTRECHQERLNAKPQKFNTWQLTFHAHAPYHKTHQQRAIVFTLSCCCDSLHSFHSGGVLSQNTSKKSVISDKSHPSRNFSWPSGSHLHSGGLLMSNSRSSLRPAFLVPSRAHILRNVTVRRSSQILQKLSNF